ncbi:Hypothetical_protein [Hexamita inflata]|uniref:Hypothetical_protein n=1 Tax=Hexamita inflata TaxID=28002 RepID=A0AA86URJ6_9EUKA|nr:Hypothetical protein HINF_LOCUS49637 [Hexamita inflata]
MKREFALPAESANWRQLHGVERLLHLFFIVQIHGLRAQTNQPQLVRAIWVYVNVRWRSDLPQASDVHLSARLVISKQIDLIQHVLAELLALLALSTLQVSHCFAGYGEYQRVLTRLVLLLVLCEVSSGEYLVVQNFVDLLGGYSILIRVLNQRIRVVEDDRLQLIVVFVPIFTDCKYRGILSE